VCLSVVLQDRGGRILASHRDEGDDMGLDEQVGVPIHDLFNGAAKQTQGYDGIPD
jgi:hypothetical protein